MQFGLAECGQRDERDDARERHNRDVRGVEGRLHLLPPLRRGMESGRYRRIVTEFAPMIPWDHAEYGRFGNAAPVGYHCGASHILTVPILRGDKEVCEAAIVGGSYEFLQVGARAVERVVGRLVLRQRREQRPLGLDAQRGDVVQGACLRERVVLELREEEGVAPADARSHDDLVALALQRRVQRADAVEEAVRVAEVDVSDASRTEPSQPEDVKADTDMVPVHSAVGDVAHHAQRRSRVLGVSPPLHLLAYRLEVRQQREHRAARVRIAVQLARDGRPIRDGVRAPIRPPRAHPVVLGDMVRAAQREQRCGNEC